MNRESKEIDKIVFELVMEDEILKKKQMAEKIFKIASEREMFSKSIHDFYIARGRGEFRGFTVPAINIRSLTYDLARAVFRVANRTRSGAFIFEIARSEIGYTCQSPIEYAGMIMAAAIREDYHGPVFIQGDHFQFNAAKFENNSIKEFETVKNLIRDAINSGFYNIDIDSSTLVDFSKQDLSEQQFRNYDVCAKLTKFIRSIQPKGISISVGGEIGEIGQQNSTPEDLEAFMVGLEEKLSGGFVGISKISVQTGTTHGGVVLPDGSIAKIKLDFNALKLLSEIARKRYGLAGAVQHGASTLPPEAFHKFVECETAEVHLATQFQNMIYESEHFPTSLKKRIYEWLKINLASEAKKDQTEEQFLYKTRKKGLGPFKKEIIKLPSETRKAIAVEIEEKFEFLFRQLNVLNTINLVRKYCNN
jgi:fructose/tagatose bisphosphate aldolase